MIWAISASGNLVKTTSMSLVSNVFNTSTYKPKAKKKGGLERFADTISAPFEAVSNVLGLPQTVETLAKPFVETYAGVQALRGKETSRWTKEHGLQTPETAALFDKRATDENLGALVKQKKAEGYKGAGATDILNVAALLPGGAFAKGAKALGSASKVASGAEKFLPTLGRTLKETVPAATGWGAAYGAAGAYDQGGSLGDVGEGALIGGATGAAVGGGLGVAGASIGSLANKASSLVNKDARLKKIIDTNSRALQKVSDDNAQVRKIVDHSMDSDVDVIKKAAETNYLQGATDKEGVIRSKQKGGGAERLEIDINVNAGTVSENLARENRRVSIDAVKQEMIDALDSSTISSGEAYTAALAKIEREIGGMERFMDGDRTIPVLKVHEAKMYKGKNLRKAFLDPDASQADKLITRVYKELIEKNTDSIDVKRINQELSEAYALLNFIRALDGKRVEGGKLGRYFAQTVGAMVGSHFGPIGSIVGAEVGGSLRGAQLGSVFSKSTGKTLEVSDLMKEANALGKSPRPTPEIIPESRRLAAPAMTTPMADTSGLLSQEEARAKLRSYGVSVDDLAPQSSKSLGSLNTSQSKTTTPTSIGISKSVAETPKVDINSVESLEAEITRRVEKFRKEAGFVAQREGAGVKMVTPDNGLDSANTESFTKFNLNRAKGNMKSQADSAKKYSQTMLYESDPEFRNIVDIHDALLESKIVEAKTIPEVEALFKMAEKEEPVILNEVKQYESNTLDETPSTPPKDKGNGLGQESRAAQGIVQPLKGSTMERALADIEEAKMLRENAPYQKDIAPDDIDTMSKEYIDRHIKNSQDWVDRQEKGTAQVETKNAVLEQNHNSSVLADKNYKEWLRKQPDAIEKIKGFQESASMITSTENKNKFMQEAKRKLDNEFIPKYSNTLKKSAQVDSPLLSEAKKYKTAEDFVYHTTPAENIFSIQKEGLKSGNGQFGKGTYLTSTEEEIKQFSKDFDIQIRIKRDKLSGLKENKTAYKDSKELLLPDSGTALPVDILEVKTANGKWKPMKDVKPSEFDGIINVYKADDLKKWWNKNSSSLTQAENDFIGGIFYSNDEVGQVSSVKLNITPSEKKRLDAITKSQLLEIYKQAHGKPSIGKLDTKSNSLLSEAKKYKSADEFVKAHGEPVYHGTLADFENFDGKKAGSNTEWANAQFGTFFLDDATKAKEFPDLARMAGDDRTIRSKLNCLLR